MYHKYKYDELPVHSGQESNPFTAERSGIQIINVVYEQPSSSSSSSLSEEVHNHLHHHYVVGQTHIGSHLLAKRHRDWAERRPTNLVWLVPSDVREGRCIQACIDDKLVGRSEESGVTKKRVVVNKRAAAAAATTTFAEVSDPMGPWFDGVRYLERKQK
ncbi:putative L-amino acid oxidase LaoA [Drepanopeziza brunnea f. sp. 'multigermtubi' MB_m1]|uniref:Putative L-amino acid oxidase LaoA n=1 Tax=Marssonina brunnea f. sp. multigermtubi (strain MB_m1) TaxID=1072389 RepID=K1X629_MARBU|nr:putative L-amino acid oxidase LaoA [Drepanopeziza brunnea f. sp. 'multigermtubi' MB_m1]EKD16098.1 putative L-amino acid oxidase LaoA [Drepanopeziza brunnea f. sp. 'multigermtubi' MB_m1]